MTMFSDGISHRKGTTDLLFDFGVILIFVLHGCHRLLDHTTRCSGQFVLVVVVERMSRRFLLQRHLIVRLLASKSIVGRCRRGRRSSTLLFHSNENIDENGGDGKHRHAEQDERGEKNSILSKKIFPRRRRGR